MAKGYLGLGSNMGDKKEYLDQAIEQINQHPSITVKKVSSYYETDPIGYTEQDVFLNVVVEIDTSLSPYELLAYCNEIEELLKRKRIIRWGPRTIDVDVLLYENYTSDDEKLTVPHPRMWKRAFVMIPLYEIAKDITNNGEHIGEIIKNLCKEGIRKVDYDG
ncbi:2-amino-4-hydroxy-6-hydroxymethyldihydropteridine diphosphokinase [Clostridium formicaceticum]|uniref:2-amino-4-hydroxy-6-hydroxymethyldihydropteridine diphosphokinase n=1 Tax=Clostridium formicaceticum TaxID=1497 RepID=A0AAC9RJZ2_9CLOT|nr:2-amino-4-hydroxy-6-hydroxymethyldihydropteridine diphosphokinase [Clostridium formicaceticum]AOY76315.1 2-amino-4-hydroxy-6-hydroxymethyldihydropteridine diphosphokinase [Clostridium formicaceticum]ARE86703.1 2-amino-4-hydroxy-6-hydroxymethyldihydropteridine pyrophosphokinase [Clostridium formicaceticum]